MKITRREWLGAAAAPAIGAALGWRKSTGDGAAGVFPNVDLFTHEGKRVRFYDDLVRGKIVIINFMYSLCRGVCPGITQNMLRVQTLLEPRVGRDIFMYSISIKPEEDTPERLRKYAESIGAKPGWFFLTGAPSAIEQVRRGLGAVDPDPIVDGDKTQHIGMLRYGNEKHDRWAACPGGAHPKWIARSILWTVGDGGEVQGRTEMTKTSRRNSSE